ncbi:cellulose synthase-like family C4 protein [Hordeum vulgare]|nr:cellulose synthase-like family C4 protein [Hordeum vulgare]
MTCIPALLSPQYACRNTAQATGHLLDILDLWRHQAVLILGKVLDDSDDALTSALIREEVEKWQRERVRILYRHRVIRDSYKAGNIKSAMNCSYVKDSEFVVIFDADFQPQEDFLKRTVPHFKAAMAGVAYCAMEDDENKLVLLIQYLYNSPDVLCKLVGYSVHMHL